MIFILYSFKNSTDMYKLLIIFFCTLFFGCITNRDIEKLKLDNNVELYPIGENNKWGFANSEGETVIEPKFEKVDFFYSGVAVVKKDGKYGYLRKDGNWHLKPKFDTASSFCVCFSRVSRGKRTYNIDLKGKKIKKVISVWGGGCLVKVPLDPNDFFFKVNGKYEYAFKYYLEVDSFPDFKIIDTTNIGIDEIFPFGNNNILLKKQNKFGLYNRWNDKFIIIDINDYINHKEEANYFFSSQIKFKFDDVIYQLENLSSVSSAIVKVDDKFGVINEYGDFHLKPNYLKILDIYLNRMALVEFEPNRYGYVNFNGKEYFKRKKPLD